MWLARLVKRLEGVVCKRLEGVACKTSQEIGGGLLD